jgi:hypothetical protein
VGKRSSFDRRPKDVYPTPPEAVAPLLPLLLPHTKYVEPCFGEGRLVEPLKRAGHELVAAFDWPDDARSKVYDLENGTIFITNPPYHGRARDLHALIENLSDQAKCWLLLPHDWLANLSSAPLISRLRVIKPIGRVRWIEGSEHSSKENFDWLLFDRPDPRSLVRLFARDKRIPPSVVPSDPRPQLVRAVS